MSDNSAQNAAISAMMFEANKKSVGVTYLLWLFLGGMGAHRFYAGRSGSAIIMLILFVLGWLTWIVGIGLVFLSIVGIWALVDAFLIPGWIRDHNIGLISKVSQ